MTHSTARSACRPRMGLGPCKSLDTHCRCNQDRQARQTTSGQDRSGCHPPLVPPLWYSILQLKFEFMVKIERRPQFPCNLGLQSSPSNQRVRDNRTLLPYMNIIQLYIALRQYTFFKYTVNIYIMNIFKVMIVF